MTRELSYEPGHRSAIISVKSIDNELALEQPQHISFAIVLSSSECYDLTTTPTTITILDNDGMLSALPIADTIMMKYIHGTLYSALEVDMIYSAGWQEWAGMPAKTHTEDAEPQILLTLLNFEQYLSL